MRPGRAADHSPPSSAAVMEEYSYTSTHPLGHIGPVKGPLFRKCDVRSWTESRWSGQGCVVGSCECGNEPSCSIQHGEFLY